MTDNAVSLTQLLIESIAEEHNVDEGKLKDMLKKGVATAAIGTAAALGTYTGANSLLNKGKGSEKVYSSKEEKVMPHGDILVRQAFKESRFDPKAVSPRGAKGLTQIMPSTLEDYIKATGKDPSEVDLTDIKNSIDIQVQAMGNLYNSNFINKQGKKQSEIVRLAKTLAAYNYGRGNLSNLLNRLKKEGKIDIYNSLDWMKKLPIETSDYINKILLKKDPKFENQFKKAAESEKNKTIIKYYSKIKNLDK